MSKFLVTIFILASTYFAEATSKPNIILILADDLGYQDLGCMGAQDIKTPHLDALAKTGIVFKQGYQSASVCGPARAGLLTGRYQQLFGCGENPPETGQLTKKFPMLEYPWMSK